MIIIKLIGGMGNQMFQYSLFRSLKEKFHDVKLDISAYKNYKVHNGYEINRVFNIIEDVATEDEINKVSDVSRDFYSRARRKLFGRKKSHVVEEYFGYDENVFKGNKKYLDGFWQSEKYFKHIEDIIRNDFTFKNELDEKNKQTLKLINESNSVSIHIRRGDYLSSPEAAALYAGVCNLQYYKNAIDYINNHVNNANYFVFSDDINWVKTNLELNNAIYVDRNKNNDSYKDMQLMSNCKCNIIANSTFSWWGAWLNNNKNKIVIAPKKWFNDNTMNYSDVVPEKWIKI